MTYWHLIKFTVRNADQRILRGILTCLVLLICASAFAGFNNFDFGQFALSGKSGGYRAETIAYIARVKADGGTVIDPATVNADFAHAAANGYTDYGAPAYGGVKKDGSTGAVSKFYSYAGAAYDFVQVIGVNQPIWSAAGQNGQPIITFDGAGDVLKTAAYTLNQPYTISLSYKPINWTSGSGFLDGFATSYNNWIGNGTTTPGIRMGNGTNVVVAPTQATLNNWHTLTVVVNGANTYCYVDGVATAGPVNVGTNNPGGLTIGALATGAGSLNVVIGGVKVLPGITNSGPISAINARMKAVWGTP